MATNTQTIRGTLDVTEGLNVTGDIKQNGTSVVAEINTKQDVLVSGENIKTINNESLLGSGDITISAGGGSEIIVSDRLSYTQGTVLSQEDADKIRNGRAILKTSDGRLLYLISTDGSVVGEPSSTCALASIPYTKGGRSTTTDAYLSQDVFMVYTTLGPSNLVARLRNAHLNYYQEMGHVVKVINNSSQPLDYSYQKAVWQKPKFVSGTVPSMNTSNPLGNVVMVYLDLGNREVVVGGTGTAVKMGPSTYGLASGSVTLTVSDPA